MFYFIELLALMLETPQKRLTRIARGKEKGLVYCSSRIFPYKAERGIREWDGVATKDMKRSDKLLSQSDKKLR